MCVCVDDAMLMILAMTLMLAIACWPQWYDVTDDAMLWKPRTHLGSKQI